MVQRGRVTVNIQREFESVPRVSQGPREGPAADVCIRHRGRARCRSSALMVAKSDPGEAPPWDSDCETGREGGGAGKAHDRPPLIGSHTVNRYLGAKFGVRVSLRAAPQASEVHRLTRARQGRRLGNAPAVGPDPGLSKNPLPSVRGHAVVAWPSGRRRRDGLVSGS